MNPLSEKEITNVAKGESTMKITFKTTIEVDEAVAKSTAAYLYQTPGDLKGAIEQEMRSALVGSSSSVSLKVSELSIEDQEVKR